MSYLDRFKDMPRKFGEFQSSKAIRGMEWSSGIGGKALLTIPGGYVALGAYEAASTYDPTQKTLGKHLGHVAAKTAGDIAMDTALFGAASMLGPIGMGVAMGTSILAHTIGATVGSTVVQMIEAGEAKTRGKPKPITQNEQTMRATRTALAMLGQTRKHSMLGQEAMMLHN